MIFCARATCGLERPSLGLMARLGVPVGGRVRKPRAVEDQSAPTPGDITSELGGSIYFVRCAQSRIDQATLENEIVEEIARAEEGIGSGQVPFLLAEQRREWSLMIFCARATRPGSFVWLAGLSGSS